VIDHLAIPTTPDEFLRWEGGGDFRWELVDGEAIRLPKDGTRAHATIAASLVIEIMEKVDESEFLAGTSLLAVKTPAGIRMPDVVVDIAGGDGSALSAIAPVLIAEIISPWSRERDLGDKSTDYGGIPSLRHYLVFEQDEPRLWLWSRKSDGEWQGPEIFGPSSGSGYPDWASRFP
jgi:Uma2 family endonuclease